jgi:hypothetical protein
MAAGGADGKGTDLDYESLRSIKTNVKERA